MNTELKLGFKHLPPRLVEVLKEHGVEESDLKNRYSDLYVGVSSLHTAREIKKAGDWQQMTDIFVPERGSDFEQYPAALDIGFAAMSFDWEQRFGKTEVFKNLADV